MSAAETSALLYRPFTADDIPAAHALSVEVKWPHRADDWRFVLDLGEGFVAQEGERVVGTALCWKHGDDGGSLGMVIVAPDSQGKGIGRKLMELLLDALGNRITVLHATPAGEPLYTKLGFRRIGAVHQHQSADFSVPFIDLRPGERIRAIDAGDTPTLVALASRASGFDRSAVLPALLDAAQGVVIERDGHTLGFALIRDFGRGRAIGPVVSITADDEHVRHAQALISHLLARNEDRFTRIDTPGDSGLSDWLATVGLPRVDTVIKMARNGTPPHDASVAQFAIINQGLG
ncbi:MULTISPECIES: GNAT family N-acetyltransferase [unclassified Caballeronia]|uniref:GNAT family N-acetyltransferase n=1 Tax=unclassified Caballeronia TaxID=2646786 RepID=UPI0028616348|nr:MULTISPECIES: GNAT family N-acetyltransferase [unclassified Caballeronia]MDR5741218.1 GNAT family N-acetyltransferase [Caballeronia sp. LZ016]MDR5807116.1 GNAT family N-acetyltransferase [Caballeronia sp. LZ019]